MWLVTFDDIVKLNISAHCCYQWAIEMIRSKSLTFLPPKISIKHMEGVFCNVMSSVVKVDDAQWGGIKVITRYPEREPSLDSKILLFDADNGEFLALMDGDWITAMRTGAVAAHSIMLLAKQNFSVIGMIGLGNTARVTLLVLATELFDRNFKIKLLHYKNQAELFIERFKDFKNIDFEIVDNYYSVVKGSDVVVSAVTYAPNDFCEDDAFDEGVLVVPIHTLGFTNCDLFFDKIFADDYGHVCHFKNFDRFKKFGEVCDVVNGKILGRENDKERILAYNIGISVHDINFARHIYNKLINKGVNLTDIDLKSPCNKFWTWDIRRRRIGYASNNFGSGNGQKAQKFNKR